VRFFDRSADRAQVGLAHGPGIVDLARSHGDLIDYIEFPFEQLRHSPSLAAAQDVAPVVLHCASMSVAGFLPPSEETVAAIAAEAGRTQTPWIGEHLAFVSADGLVEAGERDAPATTLTFTLCPQLSDETVERVAQNLSWLAPRFPVPIILENSPQYYAIPGSTMTLTEFVGNVSSRCDVDLLLDLTHLTITGMNTGADPFVELEKLPLERVVEIHVSGLSAQSGIAWDDHATPAPDIVFALLERALRRSRPRAVTIEYNWSQIPDSVLLAHLRKTRGILGVV
jgi:uncharacterized protein (UPF0276 family)